MKVFIIGAAGKVARRLAPMLVQGGHEVHAMHRKPEQAEELAGLGALPVAGDITALTADELAASMKGCDAVVFSAGAGGAGIELTNAVDGRGLEVAVAAARKAGIARFLLVSAFPEAGRGGAANPGFENYMKVKKHADAHLAASDLDWVILRPGTLSDDAGEGNVTIGLAIPYGTVSRDDVAAVLAGIIARPQLRRVILELTGGDVPVGTALDTMIAGIG